jgi:ABC-type proline/glycine betaine transport system substrate-binding protein
MNGYYSKFAEKDLPRGEKGEDFIAEYLCLLYDWQLIQKNTNYEYDFELMTNDGIKRYEVKTDDYEKYHGITNNMVIETRCRGKLSGIWTTNADYFIYYYPSHYIFYLIEVKELRKLISQRPDLFTYKKMGDGGLASGYVVNRFAVQNYFKIYTTK